MDVEPSVLLPRSNPWDVQSPQLMVTGDDARYPLNWSFLTYVLKKLGRSHICTQDGKRRVYASTACTFTIAEVMSKFQGDKVVACVQAIADDVSQDPTQPAFPTSDQHSECLRILASYCLLGFLQS